MRTPLVPFWVQERSGLYWRRPVRRQQRAEIVLIIVMVDVLTRLPTMTN